MKKISLFALFVVMMLLLSVGSVYAANSNQVVPGNFKNVKLDAVKNHSVNIDLNNHPTNYYFIHNNGKVVNPTDIDNLITGKIALLPDKKGSVSYLVGIGVYKENKVKKEDFFFSNLKSVPLSDIEHFAIQKDQKLLANSHDVKVLSISSTTPTYSDSYNWSFYDPNNGNILAGQYTSNVDYYKEGTTTLNGQTTSVWDVKYFDQSVPQNSYQTREVITRSSVEAFSAETVHSYGPFTTGSSSSASVSLTGIVPSFSWSFNTDSSTVTDSSSLQSGYGRWTFQTALGSSTAINSYVTEPGIRATNTSGNIGFEHSHTLDYYKNLSAEIQQGTGILQRFWPDL